MANGETALELRGLRKRYGNAVALGGGPFAVAAGEMCGFVGPKGAGKTAPPIVLGVPAADEGDPDPLVLDEPFPGLDPDGGDALSGLREALKLVRT